MYQELADLYRNGVFDCSHCSQKMMNPYLHLNPKHDPPSRQDFPENRRKFQLDYIAAKEAIRIVIVGEAPGLDGCGYGGIAFTGEYNAVMDLGLPSHHGTTKDYQKEQSANLIYAAMARYCREKHLPQHETAKRIYLTNAILCVPLGSSGKSITAPSRTTRRQCKANLVRQLEIIQPRLVITLGASALGAVAEAFGLDIESKLTGLVESLRASGKSIPTPHGFTLIPEIHPSPRNRVLGELYTALEPRLTEIFSEYLG